MITAGILLAAGTSRRFGEANKLLVPYGGRPLIAHAASAFRRAGFDSMVAVVADAEVAAELHDFHLAWVDGEKPSQSRSLHAGITLARDLDADRLLIALGDMPAVTPEHLSAVVARCTEHSPSATTDGTRPMVPACFPRGSYDALLGLEGDRGARALLRGLPDEALVLADTAQLIDIDTPATPRTDP